MSGQFRSIRSAWTFAAMGGCKHLSALFYLEA